MLGPTTKYQSLVNNIGVKSTRALEGWGVLGKRIGLPDPVLSPEGHQKGMHTPMANDPWMILLFEAYISAFLREWFLFRSR